MESVSKGKCKKVCENKAVLQTDYYIAAIKMTNVDDNA